MTLTTQKDEVLDLPDRFLRKVHFSDQDGYFEVVFSKKPGGGFFVTTTGDAKASACTDEIGVELSKKQVIQLRNDINRYLRYMNKGNA